MHLVNITIVVNLCSQIILQKSGSVLGMGPRERGGERGGEKERGRETEGGREEEGGRERKNI